MQVSKTRKVDELIPALWIIEGDRENVPRSAKVLCCSCILSTAPMEGLRGKVVATHRAKKIGVQHRNAKQVETEEDRDEIPRSAVVSVDECTSLSASMEMQDLDVVQVFGEVKSRKLHSRCYENNSKG